MRLRNLRPVTIIMLLFQLEIQFTKGVDVTFEAISLNEIIYGGWISERLWVDEKCFTEGKFPRCKFENIRTCSNDALTIVPQTQRQLTHNNYDEQNREKDPILIGSTVNIYCASSNLRIIEDKWDEHSNDFNLTALCKPDESFQLFVDDLPDCLAWCPAEKPIPPNDTGLVIDPDHDNLQEFWEGQELRYICQDPSLGADASADNFKIYKCKRDVPKGRYNTPRVELNETWPICQPKTTTVKPRKLKKVLYFKNPSFLES